MPTFNNGEGLDSVRTKINAAIDKVDGTTPITSVDINSGTIDGVTIGGADAGAITGTTITGSTLVSTGNITVSGTVDGRDVAADGTKLDGIEAGADVTDTTNVTAAGALMDSELTNITAVKALDQGVATTDSPTFAGGTFTGNLSFGDNDKAIFGAGSDLQIYHDGNHSYVQDTGTGELRLLGTNLKLKNGTNDATYLSASNGGAVTISHNNVEKLATTSTGIAVTGDATFADNGKAIFGAGSDLQIYHDGSNSYVDEVGAGVLKVRSNGTGIDFESTGGETLAQFVTNGAATLYYNNFPKLATTSTGVDVTGQVRGVDRYYFKRASDNYSLSALARWDGSTGSPLTGTAGIHTVVGSEEASGSVIFAPSNTERMRITSTGSVGIGTSSPDSGYKLDVAGNVVFGDGGGFDMNVDGTRWQFSLAGSEKMRIDSSGRVGIGTTSPSTRLHTDVTGGDNELRIATTTSGNPTLSLYANGAGAHAIAFDRSDLALTFTTVGSSERMRIDASGRVGIGTSSPNSILHLLGVDPKITLGVSGAAERAFLQYNNTTSLLTLDSDGGTTFATNNTEAMRIDSSGRVGIGTSSPLTKGHFFSGTSMDQLSVDGTGAIETGINFKNGGATYGQIYFNNVSPYDMSVMQQYTTGSLVFGTNDTERMRITSTGSVGIGTSSPSRQLTLYGSAPYMAFQNSTTGTTTSDGLQIQMAGSDAYIWNYENSFVAFGTNAAERMRITSTGSVGIGTSSPSAWDVLPAIQVSTYGGLSAGGGYTRLSSNAYLSTYPNTWSYINTNTASLYEQVGGQHIWSSAASGSAGTSISFDEAMRIDASGRVGIGTNSPSGSLSAGGLHVIDRIAVGSGTVGTPALHYDSDTDTGIFFGTGVVGVSTGGSEAMRVTSAGNLLVGTTNTAPAGNNVEGVAIGAGGYIQASYDGFAPMSLNRKTSDGNIALFAKDGTTVGSIGGATGLLGIGNGTGNLGFYDAQVNPMSTTSGGASDGVVSLGISGRRFKDLYLSNQAYASYFGSSGDTNTNIYFAGSDQIRFITGGNERMRLDSSGNLLVGTSSDTGGRVNITRNGIVLRLNTANTSNTAIQFVYNGSTEVGSITTTTTSTAYNTSSDYRLKEDIQPMVGASDRVLALKPVNFAWKADGKRVDGFLAHEAQAVVPEAVTGEKDAVDAEGNPKYQGIDQSKLVPLLTAALQEALTKIETLEARVAALEA